MKKQAAILALIVGLGVTTQQGCGGAQHENPGEDYSSFSSADAAGFAAFQKGFYLFTKTQNCVKCHGVSTSPKFADPNPAVAYGNFIGLVKASEPENSIIIEYAGNGHCNDTPCSDTSVRPQVTSLLQSWAAAKNAVGGGTDPTGPAFQLASLALPTGIPTLGLAPKVLRFPMKVLNIPEVTNAIFEVELNYYNPGEYRVARAKIMGNTQPITISGIHVYLKPAAEMGIGLEDHAQGMGWVDVVAVAATSTLPKTLPTTPLTATPLVTTAVGLAVLSPADVMTIVFDNVQVGNLLPVAPASVKFSDLISSNQQLGVFAQNCVSCHSGTAPSAGLNLTDYTQAKAKVATIQSRMNSSAAPMPPTGLLNAASRQVVDTWVSGGALQ